MAETGWSYGTWLPLKRAAADLRLRWGRKTFDRGAAAEFLRQVDGHAEEGTQLPSILKTDADAIRAALGAH